MASSLIANIGSSVSWIAFGLTLVPSTPASQIAFDAAVAGGVSAGVNTKTVAMTLGGAANYLLVGILGDNASDLITGVTYNGVAMTQLLKGYNANWLYVYGLYAPAVGASHNIVASASGLCSSLGVDAVSYTNCSNLQPNTTVSITLTNSKTAWTAFAPLVSGCIGVQIAFNTGGGTVSSVVATGTGVPAGTRVNDSGVLLIADTNGPIPLASATVLSPNTAQWQVQRVDLRPRLEESQ